MTTQTAFVPKIKKNLILPLLNRKMAIGDSVHFKITSAIFVGKPVAGQENNANQKPADLLNAIDLETGDTCQVIVPAVMKSVLEDTYENEGYVGKGFQLTKHEKPQGKRYFNYTVNELEL